MNYSLNCICKKYDWWSLRAVGLFYECQFWEQLNTKFQCFCFSFIFTLYFHFSNWNISLLLFYGLHVTHTVLWMFFVWHFYCSSLCMCRSRLYIEILFIIFAWCFMGPVCFVFVGRPFPSPVCSTSHASPVLHCWPRGKRTEKSAAQWTGVWVTQTQII